MQNISYLPPYQALINDSDKTGFITFKVFNEAGLSD